MMAARLHRQAPYKYPNREKSMTLQTLTDERIQAVLQLARQSPRRRANWNLHQADDSLQRMVNAMLRGTYCQPHQHRDPDKLEIFTLLQGEAAVLTFDASGRISECVRLQTLGPVRQVEIPACTWHTVLILSEEAVLYEIIQGHYDPATHKRFAAFAPAENHADAPAYLAWMEAEVHRLAPRHPEGELDGLRLA
jgi:cupin fold WbuC family metalloprotein